MARLTSAISCFRSLSAVSSFAACSFTCGEAAAVARRTLNLLRRVSAPFADSFLTYQRKSVFYSEYQGIFLLDESTYADRVITYGSVECTDRETPVAQAMLKSDNIWCPADQVSLVRRGSHVVMACEGDEFALCVFGTQ